MIGAIRKTWVENFIGRRTEKRNLNNLKKSMSSTMHAWTLVMNYRNPFRIDLFHLSILFTL